jgi:hypothetical protein
VKPELTDAGSAHENLLGLPRWGEVLLVQVASVPRVEDEDARRILRRQLLAGTIDAGALGRPLATIWTRAQTTAPLHVYVSNTAHGEAADRQEPDRTDTRPDLRLLPHPPGARGWPVPIAEVSSGLAGQEYWVRCGAIIDPLLVSSKSSDRIAPAAFDDYAAFLGDTPFTWLVLAEPQSTEAVDEHLDGLRREISSLQAKAGASMASTLNRERVEARYRELMTSRPAGIWTIHVLVGATTPADASRVASLLCSGADLDGLPYRLVPHGKPSGLDNVATGIFASDHTGSSPFLATSELLARLGKPPEKEFPGIQAVARSTFDTSPEEYPKPVSLPYPLPRAKTRAIELGFVLDETLRPTQPLTLNHKSINRHTFVCGATGSGKSQTVRTLLQGLSLGGIPWLAIEPAKAEYSRMVGRLGDIGQVLVITPGQPDRIPGSLNPLEPSPGFPLRTHVDLVQALFLAAFTADEPFPQILATATQRVYERAGWDLVTGAPRPKWAKNGAVPRYPKLDDLRDAAREVTREVGYSDKITADVLGFVDVRIGSLTLGSPGRFFQGGHPLDVDALLKQNVVLELEGIASDTDKAFLIGVVLIRLFEALQTRFKAHSQDQKIDSHDHVADARNNRERLRHVTVVEEAHRLLKRTDNGGATAHAVELFASLLSEIRSYGEGIIVAEQIPVKILPDVVKNSAIKIVHRLPSADDRDFVGAAMNLSKEQSDYVVTLPDGVAAVFADGMDHPVLVSMPNNEAQEGGDPWLVPTLARQRSVGCPADCRAADSCTQGQMRAAERICEDEPLLKLYTEVATIAHICGKPPPLPTGPWIKRIRVLGAGNDRVLPCAAAHLAEESVGRRYRAIAREYSPEQLTVHLADLLRVQFTAGQLPCTADDLRFAAGMFRREATRRQLTAAGVHDEVSAEQRQRWGEQGLQLVGRTVSEIEASLASLPPLSAAEQFDLLIGTPRTQQETGAIHELLACCTTGKSTVDQLIEALTYMNECPWLWSILSVQKPAMKGVSDNE